ncbi:MAG: phosphopantothenoylcysteine decarboxylase [Methanosaeta sp. PtaB.Bin039]|nr:MAG: phosphopantothenoylcysteine decarboxylase [Methanosaeta sp. PtaB.Bin039]OPY47190.1 MAG: phosphopantothenoylcysteine decarboxylase [Methanosaeta sp. PtaU1.Bin028]
MPGIAWAITGGGQHLAGCVAAMEHLSRREKICSYVSRAGEEVLQRYGLFPRLGAISPGGYLQEVFLERECGYSFPEAGRFMLGRFELLIVAPATSNTVAKVVAGIADSLVTNAVSLANKAGVPVYVLPTDLDEVAFTSTPYLVRREVCLDCPSLADCPARQGCPMAAFAEQIDPTLCNGCGTCVSLCPRQAVSLAEFSVRTRPIDLQNLDRLRDMPGVTVLSRLEDIAGVL